MRRLTITTVVLGIFAGAVEAQDQGLRSLENGVDASPWEAVGRLDIGGSGFCTGALIEADLVLTAAHCLYDKATGAVADHTQIEFLAGWRNGRASAYRRVKMAAIHPDYVYDGDVSSDRVRNDLALLKLDHPIQNTTVKPFDTAARPGRGDRVGVVSYARDRSEAPSLQEVCEVLGHQDGVLLTSCSVDFGASGAPIFSFGAGTAQIVSVVSAKAEIEGKQVSLGTELAKPLLDLRAKIKSASGFFKTALPTASQVIVGQPRRETGAKFIRSTE